jgi:hypothetical protein
VPMCDSYTYRNAFTTTVARASLYLPSAFCTAPKLVCF